MEYYSILKMKENKFSTKLEKSDFIKNNEEETGAI